MKIGQIYHPSTGVQMVEVKNDLIFLVEDNAIYFDNYKKSKNFKKYSGELGDFTLYSFNLMKNIAIYYI